MSAPGGAAGPRQPTEEELRAALEEQLSRITAEDVIVQTAVTLVNVAATRLGLASPDSTAPPDLPQARLAIEGVRALLPLLPPEPQAALREPLSQVQVAYAQIAQAEGAELPDESGEPAPPRPAAPPQPTPEDVERAKARAKIWTPPGSA